MLILTRKEYQTIVIGPSATPVTVRILSGGTTKVGIDAPREVQVLRGELVDKAEEFRRAS